MQKLALIASALAVAGLAGCSTYYDPGTPAPVTTTTGAPVVSSSSTVPATVPVYTAAPAPVVSSAYRPGYGIIESISLVTLPASAAAGGTIPPVVSGPYRITVRMDDGSIQTMIVDNRAFLVGDRVQFTNDGKLIRP